MKMLLLKISLKYLMYSIHIDMVTVIKPLGLSTFIIL